MYRVVYYARVSTEEEKQTKALWTQCQENEEFIEEKEDWILVNKYIDEGKSGTSTKGRAGFNKMIEDMDENMFDIILMKQMDRGFRSLASWKLFEALLIDTGVKLFIKLKNDFYNMYDDGSYLTATMENVFAEHSSRIQSQKMNAAHKTRMKKGTVVTNGRMWGYYQVNSDLIINDSEAELVNYIFDAYIQGKGFRTIANELNDMGIKNRNGNAFALTTLKRMIRNQKYKGTLICGKTHKNFHTKKTEKMPESEWIIHEDRLPVIISKEKWQKANDILESKRVYCDKKIVAGRFSGTYPLSGKIICSKCGKKYHHSSHTIKNGTRVNKWQCETYKAYGKKGCSNITIKEDDLNDIVKKFIYDTWNDKDKDINDVIELLEKVINEDNNDIELINIENEIKKLYSRKEKVFELYMDDIISKLEFKYRNDKIVESIKSMEVNLENKREDAKSVINKKQRINDIKAFFSQDFKNIDVINGELLKKMVDEIVIYPDRKVDLIINSIKYPSVSTVRQI